MSSTIKIKALAMPEPWIVDLTAKDLDSRNHYSFDQLAARDAQWQEMVGPVVQAAAKVMARHEKEIAGRFCSEYIELAELRKQLAALSAITEE